MTPTGKRNGNRARVKDLTEKGWTARQIARKLGIAVNTVYVHRHWIKRRKD
jgi:DNA-binding CsgD family transcriptional regulator